MISIPRSVIAGLAATGLLLVTLSPLYGQAAKDEELRKRVTALNDVTGDDAIRGEITALAGKKDEAKKLVAIGTQMAKDKDEPLNYNAAFILAGVALRLEDLD